MEGRNAPEGWTEEQARTVVRLGFTFPFRGCWGPNGHGSVAVRGAHYISSRLRLQGPGVEFVPWTSVWTPNVAFPTPEAAAVWADVEGWGQESKGKNIDERPSDWIDYG